jgi:putative hydrolase of the HAD superfamily
MTRTRSVAGRGGHLGHVEAWIFDLDNTLYPASTNLFGEIDRRMGEFIAAALGVEPDEARRIQKAYFRDFGTTLRGLMANHGIDADAFLDYVHAIDISPLEPSPALAEALARLEGRKIVFTNGSARHADKVMDRLGVAEHFDGVFDIAAAEYHCKPDPEAYRALVRSHALAPKRTAIFEDLPQNLEPAAAMGMTTIWVRNDTVWAETEYETHIAEPFVDHVTDSLVDWLEELVAARQRRADGRR